MPPSGQRSDSAFDDYIKKISADKKATTVVASVTYRRWAGAISGAAVGLAYGLGAQLVNRLAIGAPLVQPPFGPAGNVLLLVGIGALIGLATAWPAKAMAGIFAGALAGMALLQVRSWLIPDTMAILEQMGLVSNLVLDLMALPFAFVIALPASLVLRWLIADACDRRGQAWLSWRRLRLPVLVMAVAVFVGTWSSYPRPVREAMRSMDALIRAGLAAQNAAQVPPSLQTSAGRSLLNPATGDYQLEWDAGTTRLSVGESGLSGVGQASSTTVRARFENGYVISCRFTLSTGTPKCRAE